MKNGNNKKIKFLTGVCVLALGMGMPVMAENSFRRANIKSTGSIDFEDGKVSIDSSDLHYLADEIDTLENTYKTTMVDALNSIGTYFKNDGSITYDSGQNEADTEEEKSNLIFGNIMDGIKNSQSVVSVSSMQATDKAGNLLYYADEIAQANQDVCSITTTDTGYPVYYRAATAENLSAGTAAWVNGKLIQGNGSDNAAYGEKKYKEGYNKGTTDGYDQGNADGYNQGSADGYNKGSSDGYNQGFVDGMASTLNKINISYTYHNHVGSASAVGGCYGNLTGVTPVKCSCKHYIYSVDEYGSTRCANCYHNHSGECNAVESYNQYTYIGLICGKTTDTIESATIVY